MEQSLFLAEKATRDFKSSSKSRLEVLRVLLERAEVDEDAVGSGMDVDDHAENQ